MSSPLARGLSGCYLALIGTWLAPEVTLAETPAPSKEPPASRTVVIPADSYTVVAYSPDGCLLATARSAPKLYELISGGKLGAATEEAWGCRHLAFSPDGRRLVSAHEAGLINKPILQIFLWEITPSKQIRRVAELLSCYHESGEHFTGIRHAAFSPDGRMVVAGTPSGMVHVWESNTGKERLRFRAGVAATFSADGRTLFGLSHDGVLRHFDAVNGSLGPRA
jgi:WD40 repeat protein